VNLSGLLNIGGSWTQALRSAWSPAGDPARRSAQSSSGGVSVNAGSLAPGAAEAVREAIRNATASFRAAFSSFTSHSKPVFTPTMQYTGSAATVSGAAARVTDIDDSYSTLQTTTAINTQTSTVRSSSSPIGFDASAAASVLWSADLGLDVTSPDAASLLSSSAALGIDFTTA
jgi:hypothetical protein